MNFHEEKGQRKCLGRMDDARRRVDKEQSQ